MRMKNLLKVCAFGMALAAAPAFAADGGSTDLATTAHADLSTVVSSDDSSCSATPGRPSTGSAALLVGAGLVAATMFRRRS